jgi:hypothetical protein
VGFRRPLAKNEKGRMPVQERGAFATNNRKGGAGLGAFAIFLLPTRIASAEPPVTDFTNLGV